MMRIYLLMTDGDAEAAEFIELGGKVRSAIRAMGGQEVQVRFKGSWHLIRASTGGGIRVFYVDGMQEITDRSHILRIFRRLTAEVEPSKPAPQARKRRNRSSKFEMD